MRSLRVAFWFAFVASAAVLYACVGDEPVTSPPDSTTDGGPTSDAADDGASPTDGSAPLVTCEISAGTTRTNVGTLNDPDGGVAIDVERFTLVPLSNTVAAILAITAVQGGKAQPILNIWTLNPQNGTPSPKALTPITFGASTSSRIVWMGPVTNGIGVVVFEQNVDAGGTWGYTIWRIATSDLSGSGDSVTPILSARVEVSEPINDTEGIAMLPLGQDDNFLLGTVDDRDDASVSDLVSVRTTGAPTLTSYPPGLFFNQSLVPSGAEVHAFVSSGQFPVVTPADYPFVASNGTSGGAPTTYAHDLTIASVAYTNGSSTSFAMTALETPGSDFSTATLRVGTTSSLAAIDFSKLTSEAVGAQDLGLGSGALSLGWWTFPAPALPAFLIAAAPKTGGGVGFYWFDSNGTTHAAQSVSTKPLLSDVANIAAVQVAAMNAPGTLTQFPIAWVVRSGSADTIFYSSISCQ